MTFRKSSMYRGLVKPTWSTCSPHSSCFTSGRLYLGKISGGTIIISITNWSQLSSSSLRRIVQEVLDVVLNRGSFQRGKMCGSLFHKREVGRQPLGKEELLLLSFVPLHNTLPSSVHFDIAVPLAPSLLSRQHVHDLYPVKKFCSPPCET